MTARFSFYFNYASSKSHEKGTLVSIKTEQYRL